MSSSHKHHELSAAQFRSRYPNSCISRQIKHDISLYRPSTLTFRNQLHDRPHSDGQAHHPLDNWQNHNPESQPSQRISSELPPRPQTHCKRRSITQTRRPSNQSWTIHLHVQQHTHKPSRLLPNAASKCEPPFPLPPLHQSNALPEQRLPRPTPVSRQKNRPLSPPQGPMDPLLHGLLPNAPPRPLRLPQVTRIPTPTRTLLPPRNHHRERGEV